MTPVLRFLDSVQLLPMTPALARLIAVCDQGARVIGRDLMVTCGRESHGPADPHTQGRALDLRTKDLAEGQTLALLQFLRASLGSEFTVLYEAPEKPAGVLAAFWWQDAHSTAAHAHVQVRKGIDQWPATT